VFREHGLIRLAVGLEAADDLVADLDAALTTAYGPARGTRTATPRQPHPPVASK
jgi:hypothetical protein